MPRRRTPPGESFAGAALVRRLGPLVRQRGETVRLWLVLGLGVVGLALAAGGVMADVSLHRGVETGAEVPYVRHATGREPATNVDLTRFAADQLPAVAAALQANGFRYARQSFAWSEIEPTRGSFAWGRYDAVVEAMTLRGIVPVAVLHRSPGWARAPEQRAAFDAPPVDPDDYARFVEALVRHYGERVPFVQLWDLPNRADRWGGTPAVATAYRDLLAGGYNAVQAANPETVVVLAELDPRPGSGTAGDDLVFLGELFRARAAPYFQVVAARVDGGGRSPFERRAAADVMNLSRAALFREAMVEAGAEEKPIWATHFGWRVADGGGERGRVDADDQAKFALSGIERARAEWPWLGLVFAWGLLPGPEIGGSVEPGEALLRPDGSATPLLTALAAFAAGGAVDVAPTGFLPVGARQFTYEGNWAEQNLGSVGPVYRTTSEVGARLTIRFAGTGLIAIVRLSQEAGRVAATLDGAPLAVDLRSFQAADVSLPLADGLADRTHELTLMLDGPGQLTIGGVVVRRNLPLRWPVVLLVGFGLGLVFLGLRGVAYGVAERTGRLQRRRGVDLWPELPSLPDWRPARRA